MRRQRKASMGTGAPADESLQLDFSPPFSVPPCSNEKKEYDRHCKNTSMDQFYLVDVSDTFNVFSVREVERGSPRRRGEGGVGGFLEGEPRGKRVSAANWGIWGGGANFFFVGAETSTKFSLEEDL